MTSRLAGRRFERIDARRVRRHGKATGLGVASGILAGLVAITPAAGDVTVIGAIVLGAVASVVCCLAVLLKNRLGYDDSLNVFGIHAAAGIIGGLLLSTVNYVTFKIEHVRGHHVWVATEKDPSSAPRGEIVYRFVPRALIRNTLNGWRLEAERLRRIGKSPISLRNELIGWQLVVIAMVVWAGSIAGWIGVAGFLAQGLVAAASLEVINYVEHYGLKRKQLENGRYEPPEPRHSWNSDFWLSNGILLQLQRHSDHHANPGRPFTRLRSCPEAPQLPLGYSAMLPIAFIPPLYRKLIHPRLDARQQAAAEK
ncbi:MAG: alkane 1-monooxygenase [Planctomycetes bacterium]|jgi:alkane 1-monooxygenase|nr:alkane 1-monooxygenase [Planctomycetota bacterium]